ncbi:hypothetical protein LEP1GSC034_4332 [Leptospira interrogans str. 2003000735]|uniref:Uncharacterized protein n=7 Tax=Leptospira TaxID=171 RepID=A0A0E2DHD3_LEPIR|nr:hypothetical protein G436_0658 [Leptospira interrogans serovar Hardjo str. Norma]EJO78624.1 hypothetical protein LEP1GSC045_3082 [Leptospira interrogans serovar Pomona str. Kennewicki LC82-25]EJP03217.1 hypothetical protein LEP1GSC007_0688 [Leptospira interrogans serovar Bulgarica str. Mallika]EJP18111.1 hypothetical protein LEP1GSC080_3620 [Leptospira interrogans str. FPW2026]EKN86409.1 hypothetical protein LEP1GSC027_0076 [Leptospira interrogans str. 2002000624]EKN98752.1 hypothetical pro
MCPGYTTCTYLKILLLKSAKPGSASKIPDKKAPNSGLGKTTFFFFFETS